MTVSSNRTRLALTVVCVLLLLCVGPVACAVLLIGLPSDAEVAESLLAEHGPEMDSAAKWALEQEEAGRPLERGASLPEEWSELSESGVVFVERRDTGQRVVVFFVRRGLLDGYCALLYVEGGAESAQAWIETEYSMSEPMSDDDWVLVWSE